MIAFYTAKNDQAHISYVHEANQWFPKVTAKYNFNYNPTSNWSNMNAKFLAQYQVIIFIDTRPETPGQRNAFKAYMKNGKTAPAFHLERGLRPMRYGTAVIIR